MPIKGTKLLYTAAYLTDTPSYGFILANTGRIMGQNQTRTLPTNAVHIHVYTRQKHGYITYKHGTSTIVGTGPERE